MPVFHSLKIANIRQETDDTVSIAFEVPTNLHEEYQFNAGQYLTLKTIINGEDTRRSYSICSGLFDDELRVAVKKIKGGLFSCFANDTLKVGDRLEVMTPMGNFFTHLDKAHKKHYIGFAAGSGITPLMSIIRTILIYEPDSSFTLVYGNRTRKSIIFRETLADLKNSYISRFNMINILSREDQEIDLFSGRITGETATQVMDKLIPATGADDVYLCGPQDMIEAVSDSLQNRGIDKENIHFELFTSPTSTRGKAQVSAPENSDLAGKISRVTVIVDGDEHSFDLDMGGDSILDAALEQGADIPFACKGGVCCTCRAKLVEGKVTMETNYSLEQDEVDAGFILTCQSRPQTEKVIIDFDER